LGNRRTKAVGERALRRKPLEEKRLPHPCRRTESQSDGLWRSGKKGTGETNPSIKKKRERRRRAPRKGKGEHAKEKERKMMTFRKKGGGNCKREGKEAQKRKEGRISRARGYRPSKSPLAYEGGKNKKKGVMNPPGGTKGIRKQNLQQEGRKKKGKMGSKRGGRKVRI